MNCVTASILPESSANEARERTRVVPYCEGNCELSSAAVTDVKSWVVRGRKSVDILELLSTAGKGMAILASVKPFKIDKQGE